MELITGKYNKKNNRDVKIEIPFEIDILNVQCRHSASYK